MLAARFPRSDAAAPNRIEIDLAAVAHNVRAIGARLRPGCALTAVVKANAYGHGAVAIARAALVAGASALGVGSLAEGRALRRAGLRAPIQVLGPLEPFDADAVLDERLIPALGALDQVETLAAAAGRRRRIAPVQVEIDTGMRRHGVAPEHAAELLAAVAAQPALELVGIYSHFAGQHQHDLGWLQRQLAHFRALAGPHRRPGVALHLCNSFGALLLPAAHLDAVRAGGAIYGLVEVPFLRPALTLRSRIVALREAGAGDPVGYGGAHRCGTATRLALLPIGYADGLSRAHWNGRDALVRGRRAAIAGHVSMNQTVLDVGHLPEARIGDDVVLIGAQGDERIAAGERLAPGCSAYEITCLLAAGLPRLHHGAAALSSAAGSVSPAAPPGD